MSFSSSVASGCLCESVLEYFAFLLELVLALPSVVMNLMQTPRTQKWGQQVFDVELETTRLWLIWRINFTVDVSEQIAAK